MGRQLPKSSRYGKIFFRGKKLNSYRSLFIWLFIGVVIILLFNLFSAPKKTGDEIIYSEFMTKLDAGEVEEVIIKDSNITGQFKDGKRFKTYAPAYPDLVKVLRSQSVRITVKPSEQNPWYWDLFFSWGPVILLAAIWIFFMRQMQTGGNRALSFGKAKARLASEKSVKITFSDVAGIEEAKAEVQEIIDFLKAPQKFQKLGGRIPKGVLLVGAPGTGKTLLARAIAGGAGVPFFSISGPAFVERCLRVGAARGGLLLIAAATRPDVLDPALMRPGRFDRQVVVPKPDVKGRERILGVHTRKIPLDPDVKLDVLAKGTPGVTGADLANLAHGAAIHAAGINLAAVTMDCFEMAKDKVMMGRERRSLIIRDGGR